MASKTKTKNRHVWMIILILITIFIGIQMTFFPETVNCWEIRFVGLILIFDASINTLELITNLIKKR